MSSDVLLEEFEVCLIIMRNRRNTQPRMSAPGLRIHLPDGTHKFVSDPV
jgi:hypothetical protein